MNQKSMRTVHQAELPAVVLWKIQDEGVIFIQKSLHAGDNTMAVLSKDDLKYFYKDLVVKKAMFQNNEENVFQYVDRKIYNTTDLTNYVFFCENAVGNDFFFIACGEKTDISLNRIIVSIYTIPGILTALKSFMS